VPFTKVSISAASAVALTFLVACDMPTDPLSRAAEFRAVTTQATGDVYVMVQTDPHGATGTFTFTHDFGASSSPQVPSPFTMTDGQLRIFNSVAPGTYTVTQTAPPDWNLVASGDDYDTECWDDQGESAIDLTTGVATIHVAPGGFVVCTFVNGKRATLALNKRENGELPLSTAWSFELRTGATTTSAGAVRAAGTADLATGAVTLSCAGGENPDCSMAAGTAWLRAQEYQLCETGMAAGWTNNLVGFTPAGSAAEGSADGAECVTISLRTAASETTASVLGIDFVDNVLASDAPEPSPPGLEAPLGMGSWRKAASCESANAQSGGSILAAVLSVSTLTVGDLGGLSCTDIARLLSKQDRDGHNRASDAAYNLASQLVAAKLNQLAGAPVPECVASAMGAADQLFREIGFVGRGDYLAARTGEKSLRNSALVVAELLDRYNNSDPGVLAGNCE
jgi:hypothetical protein